MVLWRAETIKTTNNMQKVQKNVDALGFDKWQIADVRRAYASNKTTYTKLNRINAKVMALKEEYEALARELEAWEGPVKIISQKVLGMDLTSEEVLAYHADPKLFAKHYPEHPVSKQILADEPALETSEPQEGISEPVLEEEEAPAHPEPADPFL